MTKQVLKARARIEAKIEELIALLDGIDGDPDIEANGDELDIGMPEGWRPSAIPYGCTVILDDDEDGADDEDGGDTEPNGDEADTSFTEDEGGFPTWH
ncbi:hypothetical protein [Rhizobium sp. 21-4511-3d]